MNETLPAIPRPPAQRWRDIRLRHVPVIVYFAGVALVIYLWNTQWMPINFTGEVQAPIATISSPVAGVLVEVSVRQFDHVRKGQVLGRVILPPETTLANLAAIRADLMVMRTRMALDQQRNSEGYQQLRVDQLDQKVALAIARSRLRFAESNLVREATLFQEKMGSQVTYETALDYRDSLNAEIAERTQLVEQMDQVLTSLKADGAPSADASVLDSVEAAIKAQAEQARQQTETVLRSPIDGRVTKQLRGEGENIASGEALLLVAADRPENIVGFVRQPLGFQPQIGDRVVVRTRGRGRQEAEARVLEVGARLEMFTQPLRIRGYDASLERGLPVLISLPDGLALHPGELVDLAIDRSAPRDLPASSAAEE